MQDRAHELEKEAAERKQVEAEVLKLNQSLEERVAARTAELASANIELDAFAHSVSHDLRAPLRHVLGYADLLKGGLGPAVDEKSRHYLDCVMASVEGMGQLIDDLLEFSRLGRAEMRRGMADLNQLVREVLHDLEGDSKGRDIAWKIAPLPQVQGDPAMLRLVLTNLIGNALKYTRPRAQAEIEIGCAPGEGHETIVFIRDNGVGFNPEYADKLFGVFQRLHLAEDFEGTGIGLANVRRIIQRHGGRTWAEGAVDAGATFYFSLPEMTQKQAENALGKDF